jgi:hypothetical protein
MADDDPLDPGPFLVVYPVWMIAPHPRPADPTALLRQILRGTAVAGDGSEITFVPVFTDRDPAERFACQLETRDGRDAPVSVMEVPDDEAFAVLLIALADTRVTHVVFDPEDHRDRPIPIARILGPIRDRLG